VGSAHPTFLSMILKKFTINTQDSIAEARNKLTCQIDNAPSPFEINSTRDILCGEVTENTFRLIRVKGFYSLI
jgi:hypothetical protein